jgi:hypothetical protein
MPFCEFIHLRKRRQEPMSKLFQIDTPCLCKNCARPVRLRGFIVGLSQFVFQNMKINASGRTTGG